MVNLLNINVIILIILNLVLEELFPLYTISFILKEVQDKKDAAAIGAKSEYEQHAFYTKQ
jgi:hypothetical protein